MPSSAAVKCVAHEMVRSFKRAQGFTKTSASRNSDQPKDSGEFVFSVIVKAGGYPRRDPMQRKATQHTEIKRNRVIITITITITIIMREKMCSYAG